MTAKATHMLTMLTCPEVNNQRIEMRQCALQTSITCHLQDRLTKQWHTLWQMNSDTHLCDQHCLNTEKSLTQILTKILETEMICGKLVSYGFMISNNIEH
jgi:hypothetical protein